VVGNVNAAASRPSSERPATTEKTAVASGITAATIEKNMIRSRISAATRPTVSEVRSSVADAILPAAPPYSTVMPAARAGWTALSSWVR
jgi:hypothetical protein